MQKQDNQPAVKFLSMTNNVFCHFVIAWPCGEQLETEEYVGTTQVK